MLVRYGGLVHLGGSGEDFHTHVSGVAQTVETGVRYLANGEIPAPLLFAREQSSIP